MSLGTGIRPCPNEATYITYYKKGCDFMDEQQSPTLHGWTPGFGQNQFPGLEQSFAGPPEVINPTVLSAQTTAKGGLPFNLASLNNVKSMVDRMGGIDGVLGTIGKFQKFMSTMQQIAPMLKLFMGNKGSKAATATATKRASARRRPKGRPTVSKARTRRPVKRR
jgi:hypothetical protein